ncbi:MAG: SAM-dependent methyltransferase [Acidimicrobiales bacterium]
MADAPDTPAVHERIVERIHRHGPLPFSAVMDAALYDPDAGFFSGGGGAPGRRGDFITSPEVGPLFGAVLANALDRWWDDMGRPDPFVVVDAGAGRGTLAISVLAALPRCTTALRYVLVETSPVLRALHGEHLALAPPATSLGVDGAGDGPVVVSLGEMPATRFTGVVLANELLDNVVFDLAERTDDGWSEVRVGVDDGPDGPTVVLHRVPAEGAILATARRVADGVPVGTVVPIQHQAGEWVRDAVALIERGVLVVVDYGVERTAELAGRPLHDVVRTYRGHDRGDDPLAGLGRSDITSEVCLDQLALVAGAPSSVVRQAAFLHTHGIDDLVAEGRRIWEDRAHLGDLPAIRGRSRIVEAEALLDRSGLGGFLVAEWVLG